MTKQEQINAIYEKVASKEPGQYYFIQNIQQCAQLEDWIAQCPNIEMFNQECNFAVGNPVMIGDVLDFYMKDFNWSVIQASSGPDTVQLKWVLQEWDKKRESIENQSEECIEYVYNLIK